MPRFAHDYLVGGVAEERCIARNRDDLEKVKLKPRYMREMDEIDTSVTLFGTRYELPVGISPVGFGNLMWPGGEAMLAAAAARANIPYVLSTFATTALEEIADYAEGVAWFQLYVPKDEIVTADLIGRAAAAGYKALVVTVDVPVGGKRERDLKNGLNLPFKLTPRLIWQAATRPAWALGTALKGPPVFHNVMRYAGVAGFGSGEMAHFVSNFLATGVSWERMRQIRDLWKGPLIIKGLLDAEDIAEAVTLGVDGVILSNHGGRQFEASPSPVAMLPEAVRAAGDRLTVMMDSGVRTGLDLLRIKALGGAAGFSARSFMLGLGALGKRGGEQVIEIFRDDVRRGLMQMGCERFEALGGDWLHHGA